MTMDLKKVCFYSCIIYVAYIPFTFAVNCRSGWLPHGNSCYLFSLDRETWQAARTSCRWYEANLVEIESATEDNFLQHWVNTIGGSYWVGGAELENLGEWKWVSSDKFFSYVNWEPGEPNHIHGGTEHCVDLRPGHSGWNDESCTWQIHYICEVAGSHGSIIG